MELEGGGGGGEGALQGEVDGGEVGGVGGEVGFGAGFGRGGGGLVRHEDVFEGRGEEVRLASGGVVRESVAGGGAG